MKIFYKILKIMIIVFLVFILWIKQDEVKFFVVKNFSYLKEKISVLISSNDTKINNEKILDIVKTNLQTIDTPGALRVINNTLNINSVVLSQDKVRDLINKARNENGELPQLSENLKLNFSAEKKAQDMLTKQYFEHISPEGVGVDTLANEISYDYILIGENLAVGNFEDEQSLVDAWMASPGHRENILNTKYSEIGISVIKGKFENRNVWMAVTHFGLPRSACPFIDDLLLNIIKSDQKEINQVEKGLSSMKIDIDDRVVGGNQITGSLIEEYNSIVKDYNKVVLKLKNKIIQYNNQVKAFNLCLEEIDN